MKRNLVINKIFIVILIVALCTGFISCKKKENNDDGVLSGSINITMPITPSQLEILNAVIDAYNEINPMVNVGVTNADMDTYKTNIETQLASSDMNDVSFDIIINNTVSQYYSTEKFIDYAQYLSEENQYNDNILWKDGMNELAYKPVGSNGEIFNLNFETTQVRFFYNKSIIDNAGINPETDFATWESFMNACHKIEQSTGKKPLSIAGDATSFYELQMSWLIRAYTDQYFRSSVNLSHAVEGDWDFDPNIDANWSYKPYASDFENISDESIAWEKAYNNDTFTNYTLNELRMLKAINDDEMGPINNKYQNMLANLLEIKDYAVNGFTGNSYALMYNSFFNQDTAIILSSLDFFNEVRKRPQFPEVKTFDFPAMSANTKYSELSDYGPDVNYTRSLCGPIGYYGIVNKSQAQTKLDIDFMKFWTSVDAQKKAMDKRVELNEYIIGLPLIKGVEAPDSINPFKGIVMKGMADNNPASILFSRGLNTEPITTESFTRNITKLFGTKDINYSNINDYAKTMQKDLKKNMFRYFQQRGYISNCLDDVSANPF